MLETRHLIGTHVSKWVGMRRRGCSGAINESALVSVRVDDAVDASTSSARF